MHLSTWTSFKWRGNQARGFFFFLHFILFYFLTLQYCIGFEIYQHESATGIHVLPIPLGRPSAPAPSIQYCASNLDWRLISYMILYMLNVQFIRFDWTDCDPVDYSTPGFPVLYQLPELAETHVHQFSDAIQPSDPLSSFSSCLQSFPESASFLMTQFFSLGGQSISS